MEFLVAFSLVFFTFSFAFLGLYFALGAPFVVAVLVAANIAGMVALVLVLNASGLVNK